MANELLEEAQSNLFILLPDEKRIREWQWTTGLNQRWYDFPADCDKDRIICLSAYQTDVWLKLDRGIDITHDSDVNRINDRPLRYDIRYNPDPQLELQTNGDFTFGDVSAAGGAYGWSWAASGWEIADGTATQLVAGQAITSTNPVAIGETYDISYKIDNAGAFSVSFGGSATDVYGISLGTTIGTHTHRVLAASTTGLVVTGAAVSPLTVLDNVSVVIVGPSTGEGKEQLEFWPVDTDEQYPVKLEGYIQLMPFESDGDRATLDDTLILLYAEAYGKAHLNRPDAQLKLQSLQTRLRILRGQQHGEQRYIRGQKEPEPVPVPKVV